MHPNQQQAEIYSDEYKKEVTFKRTQREDLAVQHNNVARAERLGLLERVRPEHSGARRGGGCRSGNGSGGGTSEKHHLLRIGRCCCCTNDLICDSAKTPFVWCLRRASRTRGLHTARDAALSPTRPSVASSSRR